MMSNNPSPWSSVQPALGRGCAIGLGLALLFVVLTAILYVVLGASGLPENIRLLIAIAGGPIGGTVIAFVVLSLYAACRSRDEVARIEAAAIHDEAAPRD